MSAPFPETADRMPVLVDAESKYSAADVEELLRVVSAADALWRCEAEFGDRSGACAEHVEELDKALAACPGTSAWHFAKLPIPPIEDLSD